MIGNPESGMDQLQWRIRLHYNWFFFYSSRSAGSIMIFKWLKNRRRRKLLAQPFPDSWLTYLKQNVHFYRRLSETQQRKLQNILRVIVAEKNWEGCKGFVVTEEVKVTIAAQAALLVLGMQEEYFDRVQSILVYPTVYIAAEKTMGPGGVVTEGNSAREGEAWYRGPVIFSWDDVLRGGRHDHDGRNVVLHEFAHQLDMLNGRFADGIPPMASEQQYEQWQKVFHSEYNRLVHDCRNHKRSLLDCYGTTNLAEFFAVATECFFERSRQMKQSHPALYEILANYYHQNPIEYH